MSYETTNLADDATPVPGIPCLQRVRKAPFIPDAHLLQPLYDHAVREFSKSSSRSLNAIQNFHQSAEQTCLHGLGGASFSIFRTPASSSCFRGHAPAVATDDSAPPSAGAVGPPLVVVDPQVQAMVNPRLQVEQISVSSKYPAAN